MTVTFCASDQGVAGAVSFQVLPGRMSWSVAAEAASGQACVVRLPVRCLLGRSAPGGSVRPPPPALAPSQRRRPLPGRLGEAVQTHSHVPFLPVT